MTKFFAIVGGIVLIVILAAATFIGYAAHVGKELDASSKAYVDQNVPPIISAWSKEELLKRSSPQLLKMISNNQEQLDQLFVKLSKLGALKKYEGAKGDSSISYTNQSGKLITASYIANAKFENDDAQIEIRLIQAAGQWQFLRFNVNSPLFLQ